MATVDEVLDSVRPATDAAERTLLVRRLPGLLKQLRTGLTRIGYNPHDMNQLFEDLERIHLARLQPSGPVSSPVSQPPSLDHDDADLDELDRELDAALDLGDVALSGQFGDEPAAAETTSESAGSVGKPEHPVAATASTSTSQASSASISTPDAAVSAPGPTADSRSEMAAGDTGGPATAESVAPQPSEPTEPEAAIPEPSLVSLARVEALRAGCWVEFRDDDQRVTRCRLAAVLKTTGKYIFVSRAGIKVAEETAASLALILDQGGVTFLDDGQLFDRALESVIGNLREMKRSS